MKNICDWNNCEKDGIYKAPVERDNSKKFRLLCIDHVREFNKNWNYFSGMSESQICEFIKSDITWHKPTQSFSSSDNFFKILWNNALKDEISKDKYDSKLPHITLEVGGEEQDNEMIKLRVLVDTGAGATVGWLPYFEAWTFSDYTHLLVEVVSSRRHFCLGDLRG